MAKKNKYEGVKSKYGRRRMEHPFMLVALSVMFLLVAISFVGYRFVKSSPIFLVSPTITSVPPMDIIVQGEPGLSRDEYVTKAKEALAEKLNISTSKIKVDKVEEVRFSDTSLGCPQSGRFYSQVITPGYKIILSAEGNSYVYNAGINKVVNCEAK